MKRNLLNKYNEEEVFAQELDDDELEGINGGLCGVNGGSCANDAYNNCVNLHHRWIYGGKGFPNCAATVQDGSWCGSNDACFADEVDYKGMNSCSKAWK